MHTSEWIQGAAQYIIQVASVGCPQKTDNEKGFKCKVKKVSCQMIHQSSLLTNNILFVQRDFNLRPVHLRFD